jgi:hypothetical protein
VATATSAAEHKKCSITTHGLSVVRTVAMPITAWAGMPSSRTTAGTMRSRRGRSERNVRTIASSMANAMATSTNVSSRLPNSMRPWTPISGVGTRESSAQFGTSGQPRPEPVSRTAPPVTTMPIWETSDAIASQRSVRSVGTGTRSHSRRAPLPRVSARVTPSS